METSTAIRLLRDKKGVKQINIAHALGMEQSNYSRLEKRGDKITLEQLKTIVKVLGVGLGNFIRFAQEEITLEQCLDPALGNTDDQAKDVRIGQLENTLTNLAHELRWDLIESGQTPDGSFLWKAIERNVKAVILENKQRYNLLIYSEYGWDSVYDFTYSWKSESEESDENILKLNEVYLDAIDFSRDSFLHRYRFMSSAGMSKDIAVLYLVYYSYHLAHQLISKRLHPSTWPFNSLWLLQEVTNHIHHELGYSIFEDPNKPLKRKEIEIERFVSELLESMPGSD